jgi:hypothetical protein
MLVQVTKEQFFSIFTIEIPIDNWFLYDHFKNIIAFSNIAEDIFYVSQFILLTIFENQLTEKQNSTVH